MLVQQIGAGLPDRRPSRYRPQPGRNPQPARNPQPGRPQPERAVDHARRLGFASSGRPERDGYPPDPEELLKPGGTVVIDDLTPAAAWPPRFGGQVDQARMHWLTHPAVDAAELRLAPTWPPWPPPAASLLANGAS